MRVVNFAAGVLATLSTVIGLAAPPSTQSTTHPASTPATGPSAEPLKKTSDLAGVAIEPYPGDEQGYPPLRWGLVISNVKADGAFAHGGFHDGDILFKCGDTYLSSADDFLDWLSIAELDKPYFLVAFDRPKRVGGRVIFNRRITGQIVIKKDGELSVSRVATAARLTVRAGAISPTDPLKRTIDSVGADVEPYVTYLAALRISHPARAAGYAFLGTGVVLTAVKPEGLFGKAGFHDLDILMSCGDTSVSEADQLIDWLNNLEPGKPYLLTVIECPTMVGDRAVFKDETNREIVLGRDGKLSVSKILDAKTRERQ